jgi:putative peptide zinc metalloprotease protein
MHDCAVEAPRLAGPRRSDGLELLGETQGSGYVESTFLVRREDGQVVQLSQLLYVTLEHLDGRPAAVVAEQVSAAVGRGLTAEGVDFLVEHKLGPLGLVAAEPSADTAGTDAAATSAARAPDAVLTLAGRRTLVPAGPVDRLARLLRPLFWSVSVVLVVEAAVAGDWAVFARHDVGADVTTVLTHPAQLLVVLGLMVSSMLFHEVGHATGARYGGARPGVIGMGLYVVWPAFYTDVTDAYRLNRAGRLRTDLGGVYFNLVFLVALLGLYEWTGAPVLVMAAILTHLEILQQLLPIVRLDGYFIMGDLVGVPDLFRWVKPILTSFLPGHWHDPQVRRLRGWVRWAVTGWVALVVPVLAVNVWVLVTTGPHLLATTTSTLRDSAGQLSLQLHTYAVAPAVVTALSMVALSLPLLGLWVMATRVAGRLRSQLGAFAARGARQRATVALGLTAVAVAVAVTWLPDPQPVSATPAPVPSSAPVSPTPAPLIPAAPTPAPSTPAASTPPASTPAASTPAPTATSTAPDPAPWLLPLNPPR